ncbi:MAG: prolyl oligopeptidase family serine peptidase [Planctomycetota bacterium]|jgi:pimeloyl-ACP methyl ester carboxylesterase
MRTARQECVVGSAFAACLAAGCFGTSEGDRPSLSPDPASILFNVAAGSTDPVSAPAVLTFQGAETVLFSATTDQAWLSVEPASGFVGFGGAVDLVVTADPSGLADGLWVGHVFVEDALGAVGGGVVTVSLYVGVDEAPGVLVAEPNPACLRALEAYTSPVTKEITLTYTGDEPALVSASVPVADVWFTTDLAANTPMDPGDTVTVTLTAATGRGLGVHETSVTFTTSGGETDPLVVPVAFAVRPTTAGPAPLQYYLSRVDLSLQPYGLRLPNNFTTGGGPWPVAFHMHGYPGTATMGFSVVATADADWIRVNLDGRGNHFYDGVAETDLFEVLADLCGAYDVDLTRVFLEGFSMGGTGAFRHIARHPDVFAGAAGSAGWTDFRQWHRHYYGPWSPPYETHPATVPHLEQASPLTHAENILPDRLYMDYGDTDGAVWAENGAKLHDRLLRLPTPTAHDFLNHGGGHASYTTNRYNFLAGRAALDPDPASIRVRSNKLRTAESFWLRVDRLAWDGFGQIEATRSFSAGPGSDCTYTVSTRNVERFSITAPPAGGATRYVVNVDGQGCLDLPSASASFPLTVELDLDGYGAVTSGGAWTPSGTGVPPKSPSAEGPILRAMAERFVVAYGSSKGGLAPETVANREEADKLCAFWANAWDDDLRPPDGDGLGRYGFGATIAPVDEKDLTRAEIAAANLVIFGSKESSLRIAQVFEDATLPWNLPSEIEVLEDRITWNGQVWTGQQYGVWMVYPNPLAPGRLVVVGHNLVGATDNTFWTQESWPWKWPDYMVIDTSLAMRDDSVYDSDNTPHAPDQYLVAGDFDRDWRLRAASEPRTDVAVTMNGVAVADYAEGATATVAVDVTDELGASVAGLPAVAFEFRVDGELRAATYTSGSYTFTLPLAGLNYLTSYPAGENVTSYDLTVEVVRPHPSTGKPLAGLGRARFTVH